MTQTPDFHSNANEVKNIYLIDDDESMRASVKVFLEYLGYRVHVFPSARDFLQIQIQNAPAIIISDMRMPDLSGVELQSELCKRGRQIPMIFMSGESSTPEVIKAMKGGAIEFLLKPFEGDQLRAAVIQGFQRDASLMRSYIAEYSLKERLKKLTPREREVFDLMSLGYSNAQIQEALHISLPTAKQYKAAVMHKLSLNTLSELLALKNSAGLPD
jgi:two-component system response regulator FixJ